MFLYLIRLKGGRINKGFSNFIADASSLNAREPDYGRINAICLIAHHLDAESFSVTRGFLGVTHQWKR